jgi:hypothetical protein
MDMNAVGGYASAWGNYQSGSASAAQQQKQVDKKNLFSALQSGDLSAAQAAYSDLKTQGISANSPLNAIGQSLQSGDLAGAQKAAQSMHAGHGHGHGHHMRVNPDDADDLSAQSGSGSTSSSSVNPAASFASFMQTLETALEQQDPNFTAASNGQSTTATATATSSAPSTQAVLWSKGAGFSTSVSNATLKTDLDSLIQQLSQNSSTNTSSGSTASASQPSTNSSMANTANVLQSSFSTMLGSWGVQNSSVSVMNFLQSLDSSLSAPSNTLNVSA